MYTPIEEQETTISYSRDSGSASVWTNDRTVMTKFDRLCEKNPEIYKCVEVGKAREGGGILCKEYCMPKEMLSFRTGRTKRVITDEQRILLKERAINNLHKKKVI